MDNVITTYKPLVLNPPMNITVIRTEADLDKVTHFLSTAIEPVGFDIETNVTNDFWWRKCRTIQVGSRDEQFLIDLLFFVKDGDVLSDEQGDYGKNMGPGLIAVMSTLAPFLGTGKLMKTGVNLSFEFMTMYWNFGMRTMGFFDCAMVERCIVAGEHSLKNYSYFSMEAMMQRYFSTQIDKELQTSFTLDGELSPAQIEYACLDTRLPLAIRAAQLRILKRDKLERIAQIENDAIGSFTEMSVHGININTEKWAARTEVKKKELSAVIAELDTQFLPIVGSKLEIITEEQIEVSKSIWKKLNVVTDTELSLKVQIRKEKDPAIKKILELEKEGLEASRKERKEYLKKETSDLGKKRTKLNKLVEKCEGIALINYDSGSQLLEVFKGIKALKKLEDTDEASLEKFENVPMISYLRKYRTLSKEVNTYGTAWINKWTIKPGKEEGWVHPGDGRIHAQFNQMDTETGRSSSSKPNLQNIDSDKEVRGCFEAGEGNVLITLDLSGAELRIIAEFANDPIWIGAFTRGEDLHSVGTEVMYKELWLSMALPDCAYYKLKDNGEPQRKKCKCPDHQVLRNATKSTNFLLAYGGGPKKLASAIGKTEDEARTIMDIHRAKFPNIWAYLEESGRQAKVSKEARDMFGRRRLFPEPTWERAEKKAKEDLEDRLKYPEDEQEANITRFIEHQGRKPIAEEKYTLTHRRPTSQEISRGYKALTGNIERAGKNSPIQGTNATIIKLAIGCGYSSDNKPYLWHIFPEYGARLVNMVHDETVVEVPKQHADELARLIQDAMKRAGAEVMKYVIMESEYNIGRTWTK